MPTPTDDLDPSLGGTTGLRGALDALTATEGDANFDVQEQDDGSALVNLPDDDEDVGGDAGFGDNLAELLGDAYLGRLGRDQAEMVESDRRSRQERDKQYADGIKKSGLGGDAPGGADFDGASRAVHPMLAKGCVDFMSKAIKELFPATGPCKTQIIGESTDAKIDKAERKKTYMNWQMTTKVAEQRAEFERLLSQLPLGGSQYKRWWWDDAMRRPRTETVYVDDVFLPYSQSDFYSSYRVTHRQWVGEDEFQSRTDSGLYLDVGAGKAGAGFAEQSESKKATDKVEGNEEDGTVYNDEGLREVYMMYVDLAVEDDDIADGRSAPYILHIENHTQRVLGLYRNWKEGDDGLNKKHWMVEYNFIPWRGAYGIGLPHLIGTLAGSGTGALRALLDSAHIQNFPGGVKLKGGRNAGQSIQVNATEIAEIDAPAGIDDIRKLMMPFPFNGPSQVLMQLLEWLGTQAESVIATASESIADAGANLPVGTALALIEHGSTNFSAIHARCHASLKREMEILHRLDSENISDNEVIAELGELVVSRADFQGPMDIIPVSDPNIFSEAQRYAQVQAVVQLADNPNFKQYFKGDRVLQRVLKTLQIPSPEDLATLPKDPRLLGPLDENYTITAADPAPIKVYMQQDHLSHLKAHLTFLTSPIFGANPMIGPVVYPALMPHVRDHLMAMYKMHSAAAADSATMTAHAMGQPMPREHAEMTGAAFADQTLASLLAPLMPILEQAQKLAASFEQKPPVSPDVQAQTDAQTQASAAALASTEKMATEKLAAAAAEADKQRAHTETMRNLELGYKTTKDQQSLDQDDRAMAMATAVENHQTENTQQIEAMRLAHRDANEAQANAFTLHRDQAKADNDANLVVLQGMLTQMTAQQEPVDYTAMMGPVVEAMQTNTTAMLGQLQTGLGAIHAASSAPRIAKYIKDEHGNNVGVQSVPQLPPPGAAP